MYIVIVRNGNESVLLLRVEENVVRRSSAQGGDFAFCERIERPILRAVGDTHREYFVELVIRQRDRMFRAQFVAIFNAGHTDFKVAAFH